jgi:hypothetical protein
MVAYGEGGTFSQRYNGVKRYIEVRYIGDSLYTESRLKQCCVDV